MTKCWLTKKIFVPLKSVYLLRISVLISNWWYKEALEENRKEMADAEKEKAYSVLMENIKLKKHKENVDQRIKVLSEETDSCFDKGPIHMWRTLQ